MANPSTSTNKVTRTEGGNGAGRSPVAPAKIARSATPTYDEIAQRAYAIYEREGRQPGRDVENWLQAEIELGLRHGTH